MKEVVSPRIKICCIGSREEAMDAIACGASAVGLVGAMPSGPGVIPDDLIADIARVVPPPIATFLLTSETRARDIIEHHRKVGTTAIQIVDELKDGMYDQVRKALPGVRIVQVVHVMNEHAIDQAMRLSDSVDAILLDSGNPELEVKQLGGTGRTHNWEISRHIRESIGKPVFLAGGLTPDNVRNAIDSVHPFAVDVCSGVRTNGRLDRRKLERFFAAVNGAMKPSFREGS